MTETLRINRLGHRGDGIADADGGPVYVPYALPEETVVVAPVPGHPDRRHLIDVETPSPDRIAPICPHFGVCGGCAIQHASWPRYRAWKHDLVVRALASAGITAPVDDIVDAHGEGRRRAVLHARRGTRDILEVGFAAPRAHRIVAIDACPILSPGLSGAIKTAWALAEALAPTRKPLDIQVTATQAGLDIDVRGSGPLTAPLTSRLATLAGAQRIARLTRHGELIVQRSSPTVRMGRADVVLPPGSFLQATEQGEAELAHHVVRHIGTARTVADLFSGVGPLALRLAETARVTAADSDAGAIAALSRAATTTAGLKPVTALVRDLFRRPFLAQELKAFDAVVFDPPRQGAQAQAEALAASRVPLVVAVSCNPATFARDARILLDGGYQLTSVTPVDQFRYSAHIELVAHFER